MLFNALAREYTGRILAQYYLETPSWSTLSTLMLRECAGFVLLDFSLLIFT